MKFFKQKEFLILFPIRNELSYKAIKLNHIPAFPSFPINRLKLQVFKQRFWFLFYCLGA